jgi:membrane protease YdiL (CAAX protease family)
VLEEMLFRGIVLRSFLLLYPRGAAIAGSAILFGFAHLNIVGLARFTDEAAGSEWLKPGQSLQSFADKAELVAYLRGLTPSNTFFASLTRKA